jgi:hypothetical protein
MCSVHRGQLYTDTGKGQGDMKHKCTKCGQDLVVDVAEDDNFVKCQHCGTWNQYRKGYRIPAEKERDLLEGNIVFNYMRRSLIRGLLIGAAVALLGTVIVFVSQLVMRFYIGAILFTLGVIVGSVASTLVGSIIGCLVGLILGTIRWISTRKSKQV